MIALDLTFIDLFSGAGGLSLGLEAAGMSPLLAVDNSPMATETLFRNGRSTSAEAWIAHLRRDLEAQIRAGIAVATVAEVLERKEALLQLLNGREVDLLAGGPPCQGFSLAGLRNPVDRRNTLPYDFMAFVGWLQPRAVLMENVLGLNLSFSSAGPSTLSDLRIALESLPGAGYLTQALQLDAADYGVPQRRPRIFLLGLRRDLVANRFPGLSDDDLRASLTTEKWSSKEWLLPPPLLAPSNQRRRRTVSASEALSDLSDDGYVLPIDQYPDDWTFARSMRMGLEFGQDIPVSEIANHELRKHSARVVRRFELLQVLARHGVADGALALHPSEVTDRRTAVARIGQLIRNASIADGDGSLATELASLATRKHSQRVLRPNAPAPTMLSLPDDFVHPSSPRTLSVREMARLQSFPDSYRFFGKVTTGSTRRRVEVPQYTQVGNAVPPLVAKALGLHLRTLLLRDRPVSASRRTAGEHSEAAGLLPA